MASSDSQIDKPQHGHPKIAELLGVNVNTGAQSINTERAALLTLHQIFFNNLTLGTGWAHTMIYYLLNFLY